MVKVRKILALALLLIGCSANAQVPAVGSRSAVNGIPAVTVTANLASTSFTIPSNFVGVRGEVGDYVNGLFQGNTGANGSFASMVALLGTCQFSLGGNSSEVGTAPTITAGMATNLATFMTAAGCPTLIYDLDAFANDSATAATTAGRLATAIGAANVIFQFGNEPSTNFTSANYVTMWNSYYTAVIAAVPGAKLGATDDGMLPGSLSQQSVLAQLTPGIAGLSIVSNHFYAFCVGTYPVAVPSTLIASVTTQYPFVNNLSFLGSVKNVMSETNTICGKGQDGMSNRMMAATYFLNYSMTLAKLGWAGILIQNYYLGTAYYNIASLSGGLYTPTPIFYGMYLFSKLSGQQIVAAAVTGGGNVAAIATKGAGNNANILVTNNDTAQGVTIKPAQSSAWTTANVLMMLGSGCAEASPTVGGAAFGTSGSWSGAPSVISNGASVSIPPCGAALIQIQP